MAKLPCPPEAQEASIAFQELRAACDVVEHKAVIALTKERIAYAAMLGIEPRLLAMDNGPMEEKIIDLIKTGARGRSMHLSGSRMMRRFFELPVPGPYVHDDRPEFEPFKVKMPRRR